MVEPKQALAERCLEMPVTQIGIGRMMQGHTQRPAKMALGNLPFQKLSHYTDLEKSLRG